MARLDDGSFLSRIGELTVRVIDANVTVTCADGTHYTGRYRLATTLAAHRRYPAPALIRLYHERWEHEVAYLALRHTLLGGRVLRSCDPAGPEQEIWALLALYQALRRAMVTAVEAVPGTDPDRASFTIALETARQTLTAATGVLTGSTGGRPHRPRGPGQPAAAPPPARQRPQSQIPASPLEQSRPRPARPQHPGNRPDHHSQQPRDNNSIPGTPKPVLDRHPPAPNYPALTLIPIDRLAADRPFYSGKHRRHGMNLQVIATPDGDIVWVSGPLPGTVHDLTAARIWGILRELVAAGLVVLATRATTAPVTTSAPPTRAATSRSPRRPPTAPTPSYAAPGERANAQLKTCRILRKLRCSPWKAGQLAKAIHVLHAYEIGG